MNEARLEKRLRFALKCSRINWRKSTKRTFASMNPEGGINDVYLPPDHDDDYTLRFLIHELCHLSIQAELGAFGKFEEHILERVIEPLMMEWMNSHPRAHAWWLKKVREAREK